MRRNRLATGLTVAEYEARLSELRAGAEPGDTACTPDGVNWHCVWCGEPTAEHDVCCTEGSHESR